MEIVERVARAIAVHITESDHNWPLWTDEAEIAIAAVFDALAEPSEGMLDRFVSRALCVSISDEGSWTAYGRNQWQAMLAQARKEALEP